MNKYVLVIRTVLLLCCWRLFFGGMLGEEASYVFPIADSRGLTGTYGELRGNHYHAGLDISTGGVTGKAVRAVTSGYIYRISTSYTGYGKALYIKHDDGNISVYGHLDRFVGAAEERVRRAQYATLQFNQHIHLKPNELRVRKGELIAISGNTGLSDGPHLHFEIRDAYEVTLNPLPFFKDWVQDKLPPFITRVALEPLDGESRVMGKFQKFEFTPQVSGNTYFSNRTIEVRGKIGFEFAAYDRLYGTLNYNGFYSSELYLDDTLIFEYKMDRFSYPESRYIFQHIDYAAYRTQGSMLQRCYLEGRNLMPIYRNVRNKGIIELEDDIPHTIRLVLRDLHGNATTYTGKIRRDTREEKFIPAPAANSPNYTIYRKNVVIKAKLTANDSIIQVGYPGGVIKEVKPNYTAGGFTYTIIPLKVGELPKWAKAPSWAKPLKFRINQAVPPSNSATFIREGKVRAYFPPYTFFDTCFFEYSERPSPYANACSPLYTLGDFRTPIFAPFAIRAFPTAEALQKYPAHKMTLIQVKPDGSFNRYPVDGHGATAARQLGTYVLMADLVPPTLAPANFSPGANLSIGQRDLVFNTVDNASEVNPWSVVGYLDGKWEPVEYYEYQNVIIVRLPESMTRGLHKVVIALADHAGNATRKEFTFSLQQPTNE